MNSELYKAFEAAAQKRIIGSVPNMPDHIFSRRFNRRMKKIIRMADNKAKPHRRIPAKRVFTVFAAALIAASVIALSAAGVKGILQGLFMNNFFTHTNIAFDSTGDYPEFIEYTYSFDIPEGFELDYETSDTVNKEAIYKCEYKNGRDIICISQFAKTIYNNNINTEKYAVECIEINSHEVYVVEMEDQNCIVTWDCGDYILEIYTTLGKNAAIEIANSVQKGE